jgi:hypothetical protein
MRIRLFVAVTAGIALLGNCASADAANVIVGNPLLNTSKYSTGCGGLSPEGCTFVSLELPKAAGIVQSPVDGAIVKWSVKGAKPEPGYAIRVLKLGGSLEVTGAGTSKSVMPVGEGVETFNADLPIHAGNYVGLNVPEEGRVGENKVPGAEFGFLSGLADGSTKMTGAFEGELAYYAEIQRAPEITQIAPAAGPTSGGTVVKVAGSDFTSVRSVAFGGVTAASFTVESEGSLTAISPPVSAAGVVDISVTTNAGSSQLTGSSLFEYIAPAVSTALPNCVVPNLRGKTLKVARKRARRADCKVGNARKLKGATAKTGKVVKQNPKPGVALAPGGTVRVTLGE